MNLYNEKDQFDLRAGGNKMKGETGGPGEYDNAWDGPKRLMIRLEASDAQPFPLFFSHPCPCLDV